MNKNIFPIVAAAFSAVLIAGAASAATPSGQDVFGDDNLVTRSGAKKIVDNYLRENGGNGARVGSAQRLADHYQVTTFDRLGNEVDEFLVDRSTAELIER